MTVAIKDRTPTAIASYKDNDQAVIEDIERKLKRTRSPKTRIRLQALLTINQIRVAAGRAALTDMPRGAIGDSLNCPIFNALKDLGVDDIGGGQTVTFTLAEDQWLPQAAPALNGSGAHVIDEYDLDNKSVLLRGDEFGDFVSAFDDGAYPDLAYKEDVE